MQHHRHVVLGSIAIAITASALNVQAATDSQVNVGYPSAQACDQAVQSGSAKFYKPVTRQTPRLRKGETKVVKTTLAAVDARYARGACDIGVGRSQGRDGVTKALQGQYIAYPPSMPVNAYLDRSGVVVRLSMGECDNNFSAAMPRPVPAPPVVAAQTPVPAEVPSRASVPASTPKPAMAPVVAAVSPARETYPYVFGTLGAVRDLQGNFFPDGSRTHDDHDSRLGGQVGFGYQFNQLMGLEAFVQGAREHAFENHTRYKTSAAGLRATLGNDLSEKLRLFAKIGAARIKHTGMGESASQTRPTAGVGVTYQLSEHLGLRADFDHHFKRSADRGADWKSQNYLGAGIHYSY